MRRRARRCFCLSFARCLEDLPRFRFWVPFFMAFRLSIYLYRSLSIYRSASSSAPLFRGPGGHAEAGGYGSRGSLSIPHGHGRAGYIDRVREPFRPLMPIKRGMYGDSMSEALDRMADFDLSDEQREVRRTVREFA